MNLGVLSLQGDFKEHIEMLKACNVDAVSVKQVEDLENLNGLIIPGGESTAISKLMKKNNLDEEIIKKHKQGMAIYGTCAGVILLANGLNLLDISVKRNHYGRQIDSFEADLEIYNIGKFNGIFIRAPVIEKINNGIKVLSKFNNNPVLVQKDNILASTFHPELTKDKRIHEYFVKMIKK